MKIIKIRSCGECPHLQYAKVPYCRKMEKVLPYNMVDEIAKATYQIPKNCPLEDSK